MHGAAYARARKESPGKRKSARNNYILLERPQSKPLLLCVGRNRLVGVGWVERGRWS